jgi:upstream activation factor subunit UAF30
MPKKNTTQNKQANKAEAKPVEVKSETKTETKTEQPTTEKKPRRRPATATTTTAPSVPDATTTVTETATTETKGRQQPTRESVEAEFTALIGSIEEEVNRLRSASEGKVTKGVKFLRSVNKTLKTLKNHALRVSKHRATTRRNNTNSGFLKPVQISKDLAKFTGWDPAQPRSRVDVTKFICDYIRQNNLQDPEDKRRIRVDSDPNLKKLLRFDGKDGKPLTYYSLQTYLKSHFSPSQSA